MSASPPGRTRLAVILALAGALVSGCSFGGGDTPKINPTPVGTGTSGATGATADAPADDPANNPALARFYQQHLNWQGCSGGLRCASLTVPVDWSSPGAGTLRLALAKRPADGDAIGSLVFNPGGPGVAAIPYLRSATALWGRQILEHYDVVTFDPRGVGESDPVRCLPDSQMDAYVAADATPDTPQEEAAAVASVRAFAAACEQNSGPVLRHMDTVSVIRDMDVLRAALGEKLLTYHGTSYGTFLGAWYAHTFPWRVGRMLLDSAVDPSISSQTYVEGQARGFSRALRAYVEDCLSRSGCPLRGSPDQALGQVGQLVQQADSAPLRTDSGRQLTQSLMVTGIGQALYSEQLWPALTAGLSQAMQGNGTTLLQLADEYLERDSQGHYGQVLDANPAMFCLDFPETRRLAQIKADAERLLVKYPPLGDTMGWGALGCAVWPIRAVLTPQRLNDPGAAPILVVGTVDDPATPYEWAQSLASQLSSARLLTWEGHQHTAYHQGSACIDTAVEAYLLAGTLPAPGTRCQ